MNSKELRRELDQRDAAIVALGAEVDALKAELRETRARLYEWEHAAYERRVEAGALHTKVDSLRAGLREVHCVVTALLDAEGDPNGGDDD